MVDTAGLGALASQGVNTGAVWISILLVVLAAIGAIIWWRYMRSFNVKVIIKRPVGSHPDAFTFDFGYKGRTFWKDQTKKELRFEIWRGKALKLQYYGETIDKSAFITIVEGGKLGRLVILTPDDQGGLHPTILTAEDKKIIAKVNSADITFATTELENLADKLLSKGPLEKYGFLIFIILVVIAALINWWTSKNITNSMDAMSTSYGQVATAMNNIAVILQHNSTGATQTGLTLVH